jgi:hypothetical protein
VPLPLQLQHGIYPIGFSFFALSQAIKPRLQNEIAPSIAVPLGVAYEEDIDDFLQIFIEIKAFPTFVFFMRGHEVARVQGADLNALQQMIQEQQQ